jgi:hypothetical protein
MKRLLRMPSAYLGLPMLLSCATALLTYDLPTGYFEGILLLMQTALALVLGDFLLGIRLPSPAQFSARSYEGTRESFVALMFSAAIGVFCLIDLALFPVPLLSDPGAYAKMENGHEHIRHISDMCWTLPAIGLLCARSRRIRYALIFIGFVFPILVIDRNRLFASLFSFGLVMVLRRDPSKPLPWKLIVLPLFLGATAFSILGMLRSGSLDSTTLPFSTLYGAVPQGVRWLLVYLSAGPYNFASMLAKNYVNASFLINQVVPLSGSIATAGTDIPLDASNINVGTEFFPFLLALGPVGAVASIFALYGLLLWSIRLLRSASLFYLLIFLRMAYVCVMSPFAPQAYTWMNFGFMALCLIMQLCAALLPKRPTPFRSEKTPTAVNALQASLSSV